MSNAALQLNPTSDIWAKLASIQQEYSEKITAAAMTGDHEKMAQIVAEMNAKILEAQSAIIAEVKPMLSVVKSQQQEAPPPPQSRYDQSVCTMNLDEIVYDGDRDAITNLMNDSRFSQQVTHLISNSKKWNPKKHLLKHALKLTPSLAPKVWQVAKKCQEAIGLKDNFEIFVAPDENFNAACFASSDGKFMVSLTSGLLQKFDDDELAFVLGHEIGHAIYRHSELPIRFLLEHPEGDFSSIDAIRMFAWSRAAEISADRVGLICCKKFEAAGSAFFKLSSGVTDSQFKVQINEYVSQLDELSQDMANQEVDASDWYSTHPFSPLRLKALQIFAKSETYLKIQGHEANAEFSEEQLEFNIKKLLEMMEPNYLSEQTYDARNMSQFVYLGALAVAMANNVMTNEELLAIQSLFGHGQIPTLDFDPKTMDCDQIMEKVETFSERMNMVLTQNQKLNILKDLTIIATADGEVDEVEVEVLYRLCQLLSVREQFIDHIITNIEEDPN